MENNPGATSGRPGATRAFDPHEFARIAETALTKAFGVRFDLWARGEGTAVHRIVQAPDSGTAGAPAVAEWFERAGMDTAPCFLNHSDRCRLLAIPFFHRGRVVLAATAEFPTRDPELLLRLARLFVREFVERGQIDEQRREIEAYAAQITDDFEELTFLREVAEYLQVPEGNRDVFELGESILRLLQRSMKSECIMMFPVERERPLPDQDGDPGSPEVLCAGSPVPNREVCRRLIERYQDAAATHPVVKNRFDQTPLAAEFPGIREFILAPVERQDHVVGWLLAVNRVEQAPRVNTEFQWQSTFTDLGATEAGLLSSTVSILGTYARNVELFQEKEKLFFDLVRALVSTIETRDPYTRGHSERVARFAERLGQELRLSEEFCKRLNLMGLLHDVGKIGVSDAVLRKPGRLTDEEFAEIRQHPDQAWVILHELESLHYVLPGVEHHHERYDGSGYPDALAGKEIPLAARILSVADAYDAITSDRPYRKGMSQDKAEAILHEGAGTQWDPQVVEAFFRIMPEIIEIRESFADPYSPNRRLGSDLTLAAAPVQELAAPWQ